MNHEHENAHAMAVEARKAWVKSHKNKTRNAMLPKTKTKQEENKILESLLLKKIRERTI